MKNEKDWPPYAQSGPLAAEPAIASAGTDALSAEECLRLLDALHVLSVAMVEACADLHAIVALAQMPGAADKLSPVRRLPKREHSHGRTSLQPANGKNHRVSAD